MTPASRNAGHQERQRVPISKDIFRSHLIPPGDRQFVLESIDLLRRLACTRSRCDGDHSVRDPDLTERWMSSVRYVRDEVQQVSAANPLASLVITVKSLSNDAQPARFRIGGGFNRPTASSGRSGAGATPRILDPLRSEGTGSVGPQRSLREGGRGRSTSGRRSRLLTIQEP